MARERRYGILLGMAGLMLLASGAALAQSSEVRDRVDPPAPLAGETYIGPHVGYSFIGKFEKIYCPCDTDQNDFLFAGVRLGHFFADHFALEATGQYLRPDPDRIPDYWELTLGGLYDFTPSLHGWNTYVGFGGGASRQEVFKGKGVALAYLAAGSEYRFGKLLGLRLELKGQYNFSSRFTDRNAFGSFPVENPSHVDIQPSVGLLFHFGGRAAPPVVEVPPAPAPAPVPPPEPAPPAAPKEPERPAAPP
ncbi:MAG TPA: hypothetical protein VEO02_05900, partial [Thermoanaerobaculia bacterium]|nr:hypothetical protein [Thermoanaerobaculia bacterium]